MYRGIDIAGLGLLAASHKAETLAALKKLRKYSDNKVDMLFQTAHEQEFASFNCLDCANCCSTISPIVSYNDVERMAKALRKRPASIVEEYLKVDSDGDYVFRSTPCPFLMSDNYCSIYASRPKACREYPHTNRRRMKQIFEITLRNTFVCPVVFRVVERIKEQLEK
jgi:hypothetical protein